MKRCQGLSNIFFLIQWCIHWCCIHWCFKHDGVVGVEWGVVIYYIKDKNAEKITHKLYLNTKKSKSWHLREINILLFILEKSIFKHLRENKFLLFIFEMSIFKHLRENKLLLFFIIFSIYLYFLVWILIFQCAGSTGSP